jgi:hypothetical protein
MTLPLPAWVIELVAAIEQSEREHPRYLGDFAGGIKPLTKCPESRFLALVPASVRQTAQRWLP